VIGKLIAARLAIAIVQLAIILTLVFFIMRALSADPVGQLIGFNASAATRSQVEHNLGLDQPVLTQFAHYLGIGSRGLLQADLGRSWVDGSSVSGQIAAFLPVTLELILYSLLVACLISIPVGVLAAMKPGGFFDRSAFTFGLFAGAQPEFWWGLVFIYVFFVKLGWFPAPIGRFDSTAIPPPHHTGAYTVDAILARDWTAYADAARHLVLPVATLAFVLCGPIIKMVRQNMRGVLESDFVMYAHASGLNRRRLVTYSIRNALTPSLTLIAILLGYLIGGAVLVEQVFSLGGIGQYAVQSVLTLDFPAIQGVVLVITTLFLAIYLALDITHALIDPRIRVSGRRD
jgi:ABC-type dipeptide/oligopeptide/nickel transport system permease component